MKLFKDLTLGLGDAENYIIEIKISLIDIL